jgi:hypothetical protein
MLDDQSLGQLQDELATVDLQSRPTRQARPGMIEYLVKRHRAIRLRMDGNKNHGRPHIHVDYGPDFHTASYAIDTGERLAGSLRGVYDKAVRSWIAQHREDLEEVWAEVMSGKRPDDLIAALQASPF